MDPVVEIKKMIEKQGAGLEEFKTRYDSRISVIEEEIGEFLKKANRPGLGGASSGDDAETPEQRKALNLGIRALVNGNPVEAEKQFGQIKSMSVGSDPDGGYVVTPTFSTEMTKVMLEISPFIGLARTVEIDSDAFEEPIDKDDTGAEWVGETQQRDETKTPKLGLFKCPVHELQAEPAITQKLIDTARIDVATWLQGKVAEKFAFKETDAFFNGDGVKCPRGFLTYPTAATPDETRAWGILEHIKTGADGALPSADVLIDVVSSVKPQYLVGAVWKMNRRTAAAVQKMKDDNGQYIWSNAVAAGQPNTLLGYPVVISEQMPSIANGSLSIAFGNFKKGYTIVRRLGVRFLLDPYTKKPFVKLYTYTRVGGDVNNFEAIKLVKFSA